MSTGTDFRLPHRLIETYKSYKEGTKTIVEYLCQNTLPPIPAIERYPLSLLVRLAKNIKARNIVISRDLDATLRDTIALRKRMTTAFHTHAFVTHNDLSNQCHEKFTATLQTIHDILVNNVSKVSHKQSKNIRKAIAKEAEEVFQSEASQNRFEALNSLVEEQVPNSCESDQAACNDYFSGFKTKSVKSTEETGILRDDDLAEDIDMLLELAYLNKILSIAKVSWSRAARNEIPFIIAAAMSMPVLTWSATHSIRICLTLKSMNPSDALAPLSRLKDLAANPDLLEIPAGIDHSYGGGLLATLEALLNFSQSSIPDHISCKASDLLDPDQSWNSTLSFLTCLFHQYGKKPLEDILGRGGLSGWANTWLTGTSVEGVNIYHSAIELQVLVESQRSYLWPVNNELKHGHYARATSPRVILLRFVLEVAQNLKLLSTNHAMERCCSGQCQSKLGSHLYNIRLKLEKAAAVVQFDLYSQNPLIAGMHAHSLMTVMYDEGISLANYRQHIPSILYVYNALLNVGDIKRILLLEVLSAVFLYSIFLGEFPKGNFSSRFMRYLGGKVQFDKQSLAPTCGSNSKWQLKFPKAKTLFHDEKGTIESNHRRFQCGENMPLIYLAEGFGKLHDYSIVWNKAAVRLASAKEKSQAFDETVKGNNERVILFETTNSNTEIFTFPAARINFPAVWTACAKAFVEVNTPYHVHRSGNPYDCLCMVTKFLEDTDGSLEHHVPYGDQQLRNAWKSAIEALDERPFEDYLWQSI